jgi:hypothetical protein
LFFKEKYPEITIVWEKIRNKVLNEMTKARKKRAAAWKKLTDK